MDSRRQEEVKPSKDRLETDCRDRDDGDGPNLEGIREEGKYREHWRKIVLVPCASGCNKD